MIRCFWLSVFAGLLFTGAVCAKEPTVEELLAPTKLSLITAGSDLTPVIAEIEKQTGNKLVDRTHSTREPLKEWNFSLSDREFWPLLDKFLDAANLELATGPAEEGLIIGRRFTGLGPRFGSAVYVGPFRLEVTEVTSRLGIRTYGDHHASVTLEVMWEPRLRPLALTVSMNSLKTIVDPSTPILLDDNPGELTIEAAKDAHAVELHIPMQLPPQQLEIIRSLKGRIRALIATRSSEFRFDELRKADSVAKSEHGVTVTLATIRENEGLCELHMRLDFEEKLPESVGQGSWNFQNLTYLESATGERIDHAGFESLSQGARTLELAYFFDVPADKLDQYTWVYHTPSGIVEAPIDFEMNDVRLP